MIKILRHILHHYWVELLMVPPFVVALCYYLYGDAYFHSWRQFVMATLPWTVCSIVSPVCCHWVRDTTLQRFSKLEEWPKRVTWAFIGYLICTVGLAKGTYLVLLVTRYEQLQPSYSKFLVLLLLSTMIVLITAILYEGITYFEKWKSALSEARKLEQLNLETQFQSLQSQLNPHFLFNSLNVLSSLIADNPRQAERFVDELSNVYRYLLRVNEHELATVGEEIRFIRSFFLLLETRHEKGIELYLDVPPSVHQLRLPALALQILIENAVKHNEISLDKPLKINCLIEDNCLVVKNNIQPRSVRVQSNRVGLDNLRQRYALLGATGFEAGPMDGQFVVILPLMDF